MSISIPGVSLHGNAVLPQGPNVSGGVGLPSVKGPRTVPLFRDYGKNVNDALTKNFPATYKAELTTVKDNGLNFVFSAERRRDKDTSAEFVFVSSQAKYENLANGINLVGTIDSEKLEGEVQFNRIGVEGLKAVFKGKFLDNDKQEASAEVQYASSGVSGTLGLFQTKENKQRVEGQVSADVYNGLALGGLASYYLPNAKHEIALDNYQVGLLYSLPKITFSENLKAARDPKTPSELTYTLNSRVYYNHDSDTKFAADVTHNVRKPYKEVDVKLYGERNFGNGTTGRVAVEKSGRVRVAFAQKLNPNFTLTVGAEVNALRIEEHNIGVTASFVA